MRSTIVCFGMCMFALVQTHAVAQQAPVQLILMPSPVSADPPIVCPKERATIRFSAAGRRCTSFAASARG